MNKKIKGNIKLGAVLGSMACVIVALGFGCGIGFQPNGLKSVNNNSGGGASLGEVLDNGDLVIVSGAKTASTLYYDQVKNNMMSVAGITQLSQDTLDSINEKLGSFSEFGSADKVNAPMMAGLVAVGSEICGDLMAEEYNVPQAQRRIFASVDFGNQNVDNVAVADMVRRMARSFWQRNESTEELNMITSAIAESQALANDNNNNMNFRGEQYRRGALRAALATCSVMISSTAAIEI